MPGVKQGYDLFISKKMLQITIEYIVFCNI